MAMVDTLEKVQTGEMNATPGITQQAYDYAAEHGVDLHYSGNIHNPKIPFPNLANKAEAEQNKAMHEYINQRDVAYSLDAPLALFSIESRVDRLEKTLKTGRYSEPTEDLEHELAAWKFMRDHLNDPEMSYFKEINDQRIARDERIKERRAGNITESPDARENTNAMGGNSQDKPVAEIKSPPKTLWQQVVEDHETGDWIPLNFQRMPPKSVVEAFEVDLARKPDDPARKEALDVIKYVAEHLDEYPAVKREVEDRKNRNG